MSRAIKSKLFVVSADAIHCRILYIGYFTNNVARLVSGAGTNSKSWLSSVFLEYTTSKLVVCAVCLEHAHVG